MNMNFIYIPILVTLTFGQFGYAKPGVIEGNPLSVINKKYKDIYQVFYEKKNKKMIAYI